jgi:antitoxin CptB
MEADAENRRVYWHSRRGMLELDLVLMPFAESVYPGLDAGDKQRYRDLLACEDTDIFAWLLHRVPPGDPGIAHIVDRILAHGRARSLDPR